jgi:polyisoprenoid-binding protein YceI
MSTSTATQCRRIHIPGLMAVTLGHVAPATRAGAPSAGQEPTKVACGRIGAAVRRVRTLPAALPRGTVERHGRCRALGTMHTEPELTATTAWPGRYDIDVSNSRIAFCTRHLFGLAPVRAMFAIRSGSADIAEPVTASAIYAEIEAAIFRTANPLRDASVRSARLPDCARFPVITFRSGRVRAGDRALAGELTVRNVTRPVTLSVRRVAVSGDSFTASAAVRIDRTEFGVTGFPGLAARYLDLSVEVRCVRK